MTTTRSMLDLTKLWAVTCSPYREEQEYTFSVDRLDRVIAGNVQAFWNRPSKRKHIPEPVLGIYDSEEEARKACTSFINVRNRRLERDDGE